MMQSMWSEKHPEGKLFYLSETDIKVVKSNCKLPGDKTPSSSVEIVEAATNGLGSLMREDVNGAKIEFFVAEESLPFAEINLEVFAGLDKSAN